MRHFLKAVLIGSIFYVLWLCTVDLGHGIEHFIAASDDALIFGLGVGMTLIFTFIFVALIMAGIIGVFVFLGGILSIFICGALLVGGMFVSWPIVLTIFIVWLLLRDSNNNERYSRY